MPEKSYIAALLQGKCPHCREGNMFVHSASHLSKFNIMNKTCPHCGIMLEPEPGFYQGAMYVGYAITIAVIVVISLILYYLGGNPSEWVYIGAVISVMVLLIPLNYRYSRILFLYFFGGIKYDPQSR
ncbi:MAG: DUF983 domain-containing protein [Bacteroidota bacterium]